MKKRIGLLVVFALVAALSFAQFELSAGGGLMFDWSLNNGAKANILGTDYYMGYDFMTFGGFIFFDATYAEAALSFGSTSADLAAGEIGDLWVIDSWNALSFNISLLGKYPFKLGSSFKLFPLVGFGYNMIFKDSPDFNQFGLLFGAGVDYNFQRWEHLYIRAEALFSLRFAGKAQKDTSYAGASTTLGMGPVIKVGVGYKF